MHHPHPSALPLAFGLLLAACSSNGRQTPFDSPTTDTAGTFGGKDDAGAVEGCVPNPENYDVPGNDCDDDGDGVVDNPPACDANVGATADDFARAIGICAKATDKGYGLVSATFTRGFGRKEAPKAEQHGVLPKFGNVIRPREGKMLGVLSTGYAQEYDGAPNAPFGGEKLLDGVTPLQGGKDWYGFGLAPTTTGNGSVPPGFPKAAAGCEQSMAANDVIDLKLVLKAPRNAGGLKFDFNFYSGEWPAYICSPFNDAFVAYLSAQGFNGGKPDNMSFDKKNNPVSVNNGFFDRCTPGVPIGCAPGGKPGTSECPAGAAELAGTGFGIVDRWCDAYTAGTANPKQGKPSVNGGSTGWLTSQAPVLPGETFTLEFLIWDTGDAILDSSVLVDNFQWVQGKVSAGTDRVR